MGKYGTSFIKWSQVCQGSARTHKRINYLAVDGGRMCWRRGNDKTLSGRHKLPQGGFRDNKVSSHHGNRTARCLFMCPNYHWEFGQKLRVAFSPSQSFPDKKRREMPFFPLTFQRPGITLARRDLLFIIAVKLDASSSPVSTLCCQGTEDGRWRRTVFAQEPSSITISGFVICEKGLTPARLSLQGNFFHLNGTKDAVLTSEGGVWALCLLRNNIFQRCCNNKQNQAGLGSLLNQQKKKHFFAAPEVTEDLSLWPSNLLNNTCWNVLK